MMLMMLNDADDDDDDDDDVDVDDDDDDDDYGVTSELIVELQAKHRPYFQRTHIHSGHMQQLFGCAAAVHAGHLSRVPNLSSGGTRFLSVRSTIRQQQLRRNVANGAMWQKL